MLLMCRPFEQLALRLVHLNMFLQSRVIRMQQLGLDFLRAVTRPLGERPLAVRTVIHFNYQIFN